MKYAFLRAALGDRYHTMGSNTPREPSKQELDTLKEWIFNLRHTPVSTQKWLKDNIEYHVLGRKFFTTSDGLLGFGPATMLPGDEIWVLFGSKVPFILRPLGHNSRMSTPQGFVNRDARVKVRDPNRHIVVGDSEIADAIHEIETRNNLPPGGLRARLGAQGVAYRTLVDQIRVQIGWTRVLRQELGEKAQISDAEVFMSLVVPAYNEQDRLLGMLEEAVEYLEEQYGHHGTTSKSSSNGFEVFTA